MQSERPIKTKIESRERGWGLGVELETWRGLPNKKAFFRQRKAEPDDRDVFDWLIFHFHWEIWRKRGLRESSWESRTSIKSLWALEKSCEFNETIYILIWFQCSRRALRRKLKLCQNRNVKNATKADLRTVRMFCCVGEGEGDGIWALVLSLSERGGCK